MKKYVLILGETYFYDGHGTPDDGGKGIKVEYTDKYNDLDFSKVYNEDGEEIDDEDDEDWYAEDGYNYDMSFFTYKEITEEEYNEYKKIIDNYNSLFKKFE